MTPTPILRRTPDVSTTPDHIQHDSGFYGTGPKTSEDAHNFKYVGPDSARFSQSDLEDSPFPLQRKRKVETFKEEEFFTVKRILFQSTPYSFKEPVRPDDLQLSSCSSGSKSQMSRGDKIKQGLKSQYTQVINDLKHCNIEAKIHRCEPTPVFPQYSPMKLNYSPLKNNSLLGRKKNSRPLSKSKHLRNWCLALNLPEYRCDVLKKLASRQLWSAISSILSSLPDEDLHAASCVSTSWFEIINQDLEASERLNSFLKEKCIQKENKFGVAANVTKNYGALLLDITNRANEFSEQPLVSHILRTKFESFVEVAKNVGNGETLLKCPKCQHPSKNVGSSKYICTRELCSYEFCRTCFGPYLHSHSCTAPVHTTPVPSVVIGSKKSKKNLKRL